MKENLVPITEEDFTKHLSDIFGQTMTVQEFKESIVEDYCIVKDGELYFDDVEQANQAANSIQEWMHKNNAEFVDDQENGIFLQLRDIKVHPNFKAVTFELFSFSENDMRKQLTALLDFCKTQEGFNKFDAPILVTVPSVKWSRD